MTAAREPGRRERAKQLRTQALPATARTIWPTTPGAIPPRRDDAGDPATRLWMARIDSAQAAGCVAPDARIALLSPPVAAAEQRPLPERIVAAAEPRD